LTKTDDNDFSIYRSNELRQNESHIQHKTTMIIEPRRRKSSSVTFHMPDDTYHQQGYAQRTTSFTESDLDYG
jgi:hypothetical protein